MSLTTITSFITSRALQVSLALAVGFLIISYAAQTNRVAGLQWDIRSISDQIAEARQADKTQVSRYIELEDMSSLEEFARTSGLVVSGVATHIVPDHDVAVHSAGL